MTCVSLAENCNASSCLPWVGLWRPCLSLLGRRGRSAVTKCGDDSCCRSFTLTQEIRPCCSSA